MDVNKLDKFPSILKSILETEIDLGNEVIGIENNSEGGITVLIKNEAQLWEIQKRFKNELYDEYFNFVNDGLPYFGNGYCDRNHKNYIEYRKPYLPMDI